MKRILSGMRPTGKLHLGHWVGALSNWVSLQDNYQCFFMVADWHALMSEYKNTGQMQQLLLDNVADWLAWGIDPEKSVVFIQSQVPAHLELFIILSLITPLGWVWRCPTFKEQIRQLKDKEVNTYAFLGYPVLQAADILLYRADFVPVGEDQLPHLEITRELVRRFHFLYKREVFIEPQPLLTKIPKLLGLDGRKMSKSYNNYISLDEEKESLRKKVLSMFTDPERKYKHQPGRPHVCNVFSYYNVFSPKMSSQVENWCRQAEKGCKECKAILADIIEEFILPHREKKKKILKEKKMLYNILEEGRKKASSFAEATLKEAKKVMGL
ncbi:MAG: tryptophan--tRNA ligase [Candidatus Omnitrophota bacterium]|nr:MAG: tryptophan--tRNA ligase [Candidatus Omnitrophota bacterium]HDN86618.1 tryptophan--tRNA ligase [Candidatus Omnitrophota bacterium]